MIYGGYRVIETGATPGQFVSFLAAFLLAYEPAKRLARLNIDLNNSLVGVRVLYEVIDSPPSEPTRRRLSAAQARDRRGWNSPTSRFAYRPGDAGAARHVFRRRAGQADRAGRPVGRRQIDRAQPDFALLRQSIAAAF